LSITGPTRTRIKDQTYKDQDKDKTCKDKDKDLAHKDQDKDKDLN